MRESKIQNTLSFYERRVIKIPKIIFVKGKERLSDKEKERINNYFNEYPSLKELYLIKEKLRDVYLNMKNDKRENVNSTSMVEGYNNVSKLIKRISFGIKDINIYTLKACSHA